VTSISQVLTFTDRNRLWPALPGRSDVQHLSRSGRGVVLVACQVLTSSWHAPMTGFDRSLALIESPGIHPGIHEMCSSAGSVEPGSRSASRTMVTHSGCASCRGTQLGRSTGTHPGMRTEQVRAEVRTSGSQPLWREPGQPALLSKVMVAGPWFPLRFPRYCSVFHWQHAALRKPTL